jgi:hypothetical protein
MMKRKLMTDLEIKVVLFNSIVNEVVILFKIDTEGDKWSVLGGSHDISRSTMCRMQLWR